MIVIMVIMIACRFFDYGVAIIVHIIIAHQISSVSLVVFGPHPMLVRSSSSLRDRSGPIPPYTSETTPTSEQSATLPLAKTSEKRELGRERVLSEPAAGASPSRSEEKERTQRFQYM